MKSFSYLDGAVEIGKLIVENGGEISRAEEAVERICYQNGAKYADVFIIPSLISATANDGKEEKTTTRRIKTADLNLGKLEELNALARKMAGEKVSKMDFKFSYPVIINIISIFIATGAFCVFFGGQIIDALFSGIIGTIITYIKPRNVSFSSFSSVLLDSTLAGFLSFLPLILGLNVFPDKIMIGTIMLLVPGMSIGSAMNDMMSGNPIAGIIQLTEAILIALAITIGFSFSVLVFKRYVY